MAVTVTVTGSGTFNGKSSNLGGYQVSEESTPTNPLDSSGGTGSISFDVTATPDTLLLMNDTITLSDGTNGLTTGEVTDVSDSDGLVQVQADTRLKNLVADRIVPPFHGDLGDALRAIFALAGITSGVVIDSSIETIPVAIPGFDGDLWNSLKQLCVIYDIEIALVSNNIVVRPVRSRQLDLTRVSQTTRSATNKDRARRVEVVYYNNEYRSDDLVYPAGGWNEDVRVYQVDANETLEIELETTVSMYAIQQPTIVSYVSRDYVGPTSVYAVTGNDGLPITPAQWTDTGGLLTLEINPDSKSMKMTVIGSSIEEYAPYRIAVASGPSDTYSSLRVVGDGVFTDRQTIIVPTGVAPESTGVDIGATVDIPFVSTVDQAWTLALRASGKYAGSDHTFRASASIVNRRGDRGNAQIATFEDWNALFSGQTFGQWNTNHSGDTFGDVTNELINAVAGSFENQAFGNVAGATFTRDRSVFRVRRSTIGPEGVQFDATAETSFEDFNASWSGMTFADFNSEYNGLSFGDFGLRPLQEA